MPGIYWMAALVLAVTTALSLLMLKSYSPLKGRTLWLMAAGLPLSFLVNRFVKTPVLQGIGQVTGVPLALNLQTPIWFILVIWMCAPVFEEAIKAAPMLLPGLRKSLNDPGDALLAGLALGLGFGLGEAAYLAYGLGQSPQYASLPWYIFTGYAVERMIVTFGHGFMTSLFTLGLQRGGGRAVSGYFSAVGLHALINLGPILVPLHVVSLAFASFLADAFILVAFVIFQRQVRAVRASSSLLVGSEEKVYYQRTDL